MGIESDTCICIGDVREPVVPASDGSLVVRRTGLPVTIDEPTTHVSTGALFGIGLSNDSTRWHAVGGIVAAWVVTLPVSALLAAGTVWLIAG